MVAGHCSLQQVRVSFHAIKSMAPGKLRHAEYKRYKMKVEGSNEAGCFDHSSADKKR